MLKSVRLYWLLRGSSTDWSASTPRATTLRPRLRPAGVRNEMVELMPKPLQLIAVVATYIDTVITRKGKMMTMSRQ